MKYIFGPVPSRRLGRSLGIDPTPASTSRIPPRAGTSPRTRKICNWNCVYCQLGPTRPFTMSRATFFPVPDMLVELRDALGSVPPREIDWITFVGSGEPTLNLDLGAMLRGVKAMTDIPIAVITNGSLLSSPAVRKDISLADAILPTLDAGNAHLFHRINRPPSRFGFEDHVNGLISTRKEFSGKLWLEVMLIAGLNDGEAALWELAAAMARVRPDQIHILLPNRPPAENWVLPADEEGLLRASSILGEIAPVLHPHEERGAFDIGHETDPLDAAAAILARHPMSDQELRIALARRGVIDTDAAMRSLLDSGRAVEVRRFGRRFWRHP